jgi:hypothetical protein
MKTPILQTISAISLGALWLCSCSTLKVTSDHTNSSDFSQYKTYRWIPAPAYAGRGKPRSDSPALRTQVQQRVDAEMQKRGYRRVDQGSSDLLVGYFASVSAKTRVTQVDTSMGFSSSLPAYVNTSYMIPTTTTLVDQFEEGTLVIGVGDAKSRRLLWRGSAEAEIGLDDSVGRRESRIDKAVTKMFRSFPKK